MHATRISTIIWQPISQELSSVSKGFIDQHQPSIWFLKVPAFSRHPKELIKCNKISNHTLCLHIWKSRCLCVCWFKQHSQVDHSFSNEPFSAMPLESAVCLFDPGKLVKSWHRSLKRHRIFTGLGFLHRCSERLPGTNHFVDLRNRLCVS